jgi:transcriptional regulator with XRE-family HTH domain
MAEGLHAKGLRYWRRRRAWTQHELATRAGVAQVTVARAETGHAIRPAIVRRLAEALDVTIDQVLGEAPGHEAAAA